jgi:ATP-dependent RNA helicase RhlE
MRGSRASGGRSGGERRRFHDAPRGQQSRGRGGRARPSFDPSMFINRNPAPAQAPEAYMPTHATFADFHLSQQTHRSLERMGLRVPSAIQDQIIPHILEGRDVVGLAETGTGKTAAFLIPLVERFLKDSRQQALILAPTRELALQIDVEYKKIIGNARLYSAVCVGGTGIQPQLRALHRNPHFIIGTPGRVLDLIQRKAIVPARITTVVLDEVDRMLDMGFIHDMRKILEHTPVTRNTLFFSATMTKEAKVLAETFLNNPVHVSVKKRDVTTNIAQDVVMVRHDEKYETLRTMLADTATFPRVIVFGAMKHSVGKLAEQLTKDAIPAEALHGNKSHGQRQRALRNFKDGRVRVLVATDVAARGIHVDNVSHVINYDLPTTFEDYVHRIGRTGRGAHTGKALTFIPQR